MEPTRSLVSRSIPAAALYGTTTAGGFNNDGTVYEIASGSNTITTIASFTGANGSDPQAGVTLDTPGDIFGTTIGGLGMTYEIQHGTNTIATLASFHHNDGVQTRKAA